MTNLEELRFIAKVARLYHVIGMKQSAIARQLNISQATVSRLLKRAEDEHIVRITVSMPEGVYTHLEEQLEQRYALNRAIVVDCAPNEDDESLLSSLGAAAAYYVQSTLSADEVIGISSWSATLLAMVDAIAHQNQTTNARIVQILGGVGSPSAEVHATRLTERLANVLGARAVFLPAPGIAVSKEARNILMRDHFVQEAFSLFDEVTLALVGIGDVRPSKLLTSSGNVFSPDELGLLESHGAVGDICLNFFDIHGQAVNVPIEKAVIGMSLEQMAKVQRSVGIAGGMKKHAAIRGALEGRYINVLITDQITAEALISAPDERV